VNIRILSAALLLASHVLLNAQEKLPAGDPSGTPPPSWDQIRRVSMSGGLRAFWNVAGGDNATNYREAAMHGFEMVDLLSTYSDYPGKQKENIRKTLDVNRTNPWQRLLATFSGWQGSGVFRQ
jgi:hypothetical protein